MSRIMSPAKATAAKNKPAKKQSGSSPQAQLDDFLDKFTPPIADDARVALRRMRARLPGAIELVYDNYNALAIGFGPSERTSEAIFSIALFPRWVSLFFLQAKGLPDPDKLLRGNGSVARHIVLSSPAMLHTPPLQTMMHEALERPKVALDA